MTAFYEINVAIQSSVLTI